MAGTPRRSKARLSPMLLRLEVRPHASVLLCFRECFLCVAFHGIFISCAYGLHTVHYYQLLIASSSTFFRSPWRFSTWRRCIVCFIRTEACCQIISSLLTKNRMFGVSMRSVHCWILGSTHARIGRSVIKAELPAPQPSIFGLSQGRSPRIQ